MKKRLPVMMMDIDDVLCLSSLIGGWDALRAVKRQAADPDAVHRDLFNVQARAAMRRVHEELAGDVSYVISSTWHMFFSRDQLADIFRKTGLDFVAERMQKDQRWRTPVGVGRGGRVGEVAAWLARHDEGGPQVIVDDTYSGPTIKSALKVESHPFAGRVVLCHENIGLLDRHVAAIVDALRRPLAGHDFMGDAHGR